MTAWKLSCHSQKTLLLAQDLLPFYLASVCTECLGGPQQPISCVEDVGIDALDFPDAEDWLGKGIGATANGTG